ncbi:class I SAM-dependent methyltransferase [Psychrobacillus sp. MER TA 171]|uniref:class I SAM-dependent methyltransferase n=1 Tax=Psychrobacillus sp. MER TA 171 TaxID=2939577 RepID=UPI0020402E04|nr:class I SAM-dependent methyltransferase [Psychrobacillus sp. MER TA 171]MCM3357224.1 class I SAM-dependent methyltransferase [Psychrobacillus sp. MER TA 171]
MKDRVIQAYNQLADDYEFNVDQRSIYNTEYERPEMVKQMPSNLNNLSVLDAGCAAGWYTSQLIREGATVTAIDISPKMVEATKRRVKDIANVLCLSLEEELPFEDNSFDLIISSLVLHYINDWELTFKEFQRILKPGGQFIFSVHHPSMDMKKTEEGDYFAHEFIIDQWKRDGKIIEVPFYRRPMQAILNETLKYFKLERLIEPQPTEEFKNIDPKGYHKLMTTPHFLIINARN